MKLEDMSAQWELYATAWSAVGDTERSVILHRVLATDFSYIDPRIECKTPGEMQKNLEAFQGRQPGGRFALRDCLAHHDVALINWQLIKSDGAASNVGYDFVQFSPSGQISKITGFFARPSVPAAA